MVKRFEHGDESEFAAQRDALVKEFRGWLVDQHGDREGEPAAAAETFINWQWNYTEGDLFDIEFSAVDEFLLGWCPAKYAAPQSDAEPLCRGLSIYLEFLARTDRLAGGSSRAAHLITAIDEIVPEVFEAMGDQSRFGIGKSLFSTPLTDESGAELPDMASLVGADVSEDDLQALLDQRMEAFNSLSFEERKSITDPALAGPDPEPVDLGYAHVPPPLDEVEAGALASPLVSKVHGLLDYLGPSGRTTTQTGNFRLADARELVDLLDTGDEFDPESGPIAGTTRSSSQLRWLSLVADVAQLVGAIELTKTKMKPVGEWLDQPLTDRATAIIDALVELGPLSSRRHSLGVFDALNELLDDGVPHWLAAVLREGEVRSLDDVDEHAVAVATENFAYYAGLWRDDHWSEMVRDDVARLFTVLEYAGIVEIDGRERTVDEFGFVHRRGGEFWLTPFGRHTMVPHIMAAGYRFTILDDLATAEAAVAVDALINQATEPQAVLEQWWPDQPVAKRAHALGAVAADADGPARRLGAIALIEALGTSSGFDAVAPVVRELLDTGASAHAANLLLTHGLATHDEVEGFFTVGPMVDMLWTLLGSPADITTVLAQVDDESYDHLLEDMWRHDQPETAEVLDAIGRHHPDKQAAKAARKAAMKHRSWIANRRS